MEFLGRWMMLLLREIEKKQTNIYFKFESFNLNGFLTKARHVKHTSSFRIYGCVKQGPLQQ